MGKNHLARLAAPKAWHVPKKGMQFLARPVPGPHSFNTSFTINYLLKELLAYAKTRKEIRKILYESQILIDGVVRKEHKFPLGFMDVVQIPSLGESYRVVLTDHGHFTLISLPKNEVSLKLLKVVKKTVLPGKKLQVTFHDGKNLLVDAFDFATGDSVLFDLEKKRIVKVLPLEKGCLVYLLAGSHVGKLAKIKDVISSQDLQQPKVVVDINGTEYITLKKYALVVGKNTPEILLEVKQ